MTGLEIIALASVAGWLAVLSLVSLLNIRQIAILTVRVDNASSVNLNEDGMPLGLEVPAEVVDGVPEVRRSAIVVLMSATCGPCREVAASMDGLSVPDPVTILLTGDPEQREVVAALLPAGFSTVQDPAAARLAELLQINSSPFAMRITDGVVAAKAYLSESRTLERLYEQVDDESPGLDHSNLEVIANVD